MVVHSMRELGDRLSHKLCFSFLNKKDCCRCLRLNFPLFSISSAHLEKVASLFYAFAFPLSKWKQKHLTNSARDDKGSESFTQRRTCLCARVASCRFGPVPAAPPPTPTSNTSALRSSSSAHAHLEHVRAPEQLYRLPQ